MLPLAVSLAAAVTQPALPTTLPAEASARSAVARDLAQKPDAPALLARLHPRVRRQGAALHVGENIFEDRGVCEGAGTCERYRLQAATTNGGWIGIDFSDGEYSDHLLTDGSGQNPVWVGDRPDFAPGDRYAITITASESENHGAAHGVQLWAVHRSVDLVRAVPFAVAPYPQATGWRSSRCFAFTSGALGGPRTTRYLIDARPEWRLAARPSRACRARK